MRSAQNVHPEFGLWSNLRREAGCTVAFIICGSIAAASGLVLQMAGHDANVSVIAAVPLNPSTTLSTIVSPASSAMSAPNSRQGAASPSNSPQTAIPRGVTASTREATPDLPQQPVAASNSPQTAPLNALAVTASTTTTEPSQQPVAASKSQKAVRSPNQRNKGWYDAAAWGGYAHQRPSSSW